MTFAPSNLPATDPIHCPLCGASNQCAMEIERESGLKQPPCWCTQVDFNREVLEGVAAGDRGRACICARCAQQDGGP
ncbi:MAG: cysteine-rich CWC family protein [Ramlibacter sp.]